MNRSMKTVNKIPVYLISFLFLISAAGCRSTEKASIMPVMNNTVNLKPTERTIVVAESRDLDEFLNVKALISYDETEELSFKISNYKLKTIYVSRDEHVEEGQLLADLDSSDLEFQLKLRQIDLQRVQLRYDKVQNEPDNEYSDKDTELASLKLDMESIQLDMDHIKDQIEKTKLKAPFSGVINFINTVQPGTMILAYDKIMTICKPDSIILESEVLNPYVSNIDLSGIETGMKVVLIYGSKETRTEIPATITEIVNTDPGVVGNPNRILSESPPFRVYIKPDGYYPDKLVVDRTVVLSINMRTLKNAVVLPKTAIHGFGQDFLVKVVKGDKVVTRRVITGYQDNEEEIVVITSGLLAGESVLMK